MKRFHVHLGVENLDRSIGFYSNLFGAGPSVRKDDYAKWMLDDPRINFAISQRGSAAGVNHLGLQVESADELAAVRAQFEAADAATALAEPECQLLLREIGQALGDRSAGDCVGGVPHARGDPVLRWRKCGSIDAGRVLLAGGGAAGGRKRLLRPGSRECGRTRAAHPPPARHRGVL